jgi:hypothetical protein
MRLLKPTTLAVFVALFAIMALAEGKAHAQKSYRPPNDELPNPYREPQSFGQLPKGWKQFIFFSGIDVDAKDHIWIFMRCPGGGCSGTTVDTVVEFDTSGKLLRSWGGGLFNQAHSLDVDKDGNIWLVDSQVKDGRGSQVFKFTPEGKLLMTLGKAGVVGDGPDEFNQPNAVKIGPNGDIFVASGHDFPKCENSRIEKFSKDGTFIKEFGRGSGVAQVKCPHQLAFDSKGRLFVAEMGSTHRVSIFDQDGNYITAWKQFGGPTGIYIDDHDVLYATDSLATDDFYMNPTQPGWAYDPGVMRGVRIGSVTDGKVTGFIPDPSQMGPAHGREVGVVDHEGNFYQVPENPAPGSPNPVFRKYVKK